MKRVITIICQPPKASKAKTKTRSLGIKLKVISLMEVAACTIPTTTPTSSAIPNSGLATITATHNASWPNVKTSETTIAVPYCATRKLATSDCINKAQPSATTNSINLKGIEIIIGDNIIIPMDISTLATTRSIMTKGI